MQLPEGYKQELSEACELAKTAIATKSKEYDIALLDNDLGRILGELLNERIRKFNEPSLSEAIVDIQEIFEGGVAYKGYLRKEIELLKLQYDEITEKREA